jgi:hypothetical protein
MSAQVPTYEEFVQMALERIDLADKAMKNVTSTTAEHHRQLALVYATLAAGVTPNIDLARTRVFEVIDQTQASEPATLIDLARMTDFDDSQACCRSKPIGHSRSECPKLNIAVDPVVEAPPTTLSQATGTEDLDDVIEESHAPVDPNCPATECGHSSKAHYSMNAKSEFGCKFCGCPRSRERVIRASKAIGSETL